MTTQTTQAPRGTGVRRRSPGVHLGISDLNAEVGIGRSTIYDRRAAPAPNPLVQAGGDR